MIRLSFWEKLTFRASCIYTSKRLVDFSAKRYSAPSSAKTKSPPEHRVPAGVLPHTTLIPHRHTDLALDVVQHRHPLTHLLQPVPAHRDHPGSCGKAHRLSRPIPPPTRPRGLRRPVRLLHRPRDGPGPDGPSLLRPRHGPLPDARPHWVWGRDEPVWVCRWEPRQRERP